jgi:hypothetical protein
MMNIQVKRWGAVFIVEARGDLSARPKDAEDAESEAITFMAFRIHRGTRLCHAKQWPTPPSEVDRGHMT